LTPSDTDAVEIGAFAPSADKSDLRGLGPFSGRALRLGAWGLSGALIALVLALLASNGPTGSGYLAAEWVMAAIWPLSIVAASFAARNSRGHERGFWLFLIGAMTLLGLDQISYVVSISRMAVPGPINVTTSYVFGLVAAVPILVFFATLSGLGGDSLLGRTRFVVDTVALEVALAGVLYGLVIAPWFSHVGHATASETALGAVVPVVCLTVAVLAARTLLSPAAGRLDSWERIVGWAIVVFAGGNALWPLFFVATEYGYARGLVTYLFELIAFIPGAALFVAAVYQYTTLRSRGPMRPLPASRVRRPMLYSIGVPVAQIVAIPVLGAMALGFGGGSAQRLAMVFAVVVVSGLVMLRTGLTVAENSHLFNRAVTDPLTGLNNHRHFQERLEAEIRSADRFGQSVAVAVIDLDEFSRVNSVKGHAGGDASLNVVAAQVRAAVRDADVVCRVGGDEIAVIFADTEAATAAAICRRIRDSLRTGECVDGWPVTGSIGVAAYPAHASDREELVRKADGAQYWAKYHGKNQVVVYDPEVVVALNAEERIRNLQQQSHLATVRALAAAVDARDPQTQFHSRNVATLAVALAEEVGLDRNKVQLIEVAALLHDIGKIGISDAVLRKTGKLTPAERAHIEEHPLLGEQILSSTRLVEILPWVVAHHERFDGTGYPRRLKGEAIPYEARILAVCDAYDAMTSDRPYRSALSKAAAVQEVDLNIGTQFDPALAEAFIGLVARGLRA
jgi:diguanylate cyclase (GGDEF)-like protein/putative nucleotidyltransferase with HDIG domain